MSGGGRIEHNVAVLSGRDGLGKGPEHGDFLGARRAETYIGDGPNFMVKSIAEKSGVPMPSFFGYMVYSFVILLPILALVGIWLL